MSVLWRISSNHFLSTLWTQLFLLDFLFMYFTIESFLLFCAFITHTMIHSWLTNDLLWAIWAKSWKSYPCYLFTFFIEENEPTVPPAGVHLTPPPICWPDPLVQAHPGQAQAQESSVASLGIYWINVYHWFYSCFPIWLTNTLQNVIYNVPFTEMWLEHFMLCDVKVVLTIG